MRNFRTSNFTPLVALLALVSIATGEFALSAEPEVRRGIVFAEASGQKLALDLHLPGGDAVRPLIVWVHGGAWRAGSRTEMPLGALVRDGFAVASVDYRLSPVARFPAQVHDIKAAIRLLRSRAAEFRIEIGRAHV